MPNVWNIGNTTVRNPKRIENAIKVFVKAGFSGNVKGSEREAGLHQALKDYEVLEFDGNSSDWNGRKWRAAFYQLGFITYEKYNIGGALFSVGKLFESFGGDFNTIPYQITNAGRKLISAELVPQIDEIYLKQFCCYELPNSLEKGFPDGKLKPFILFLEVLSILQDRNEPGLNKLETGLFLQKFQDHKADLAEKIVQEILLFRQDLLNKSPKDVKGTKERYVVQLGIDTGINPNSIVKDYADTTFRYFNLSGLFSRVGDTLIIRANKRLFVKELLKAEPNFMFDDNPIEYFKNFYNNSYPIPTDDVEFSLSEIDLLKHGVKNRQHPLLKEANELTRYSDINLIQYIRYKLIEYNNWEREEDYANEQQSKDAIEDILRYLKALNNVPIINAPEIDDRPAFLEWVIWRSFLAINEIKCKVHETRRFSIDQDFYPRNTAPGGGADVVFQFETFVLVLEVTLTTSHRQMAAESEPVRRHVVQYKKLYPDKEVYCLFVAPSIDNNVAESFRIGVWYDGEEEEYVNIVPMSLGDYIIWFETLQYKKISNLDFKNLLDRSLIFRNFRAPQWKSNISEEVLAWKKRILMEKFK